MVKMLMKSLMSKVLNTPIVIEEGTSGEWKYRKWSTGKVEAWGHILLGTISINVSSPQYGGYRSNEISVTIPSGLFSSAPRVVGIKASSQAGGLYSLFSNSATSLGCFYWAATSVTATGQYLDIYAWTD